MILPTGVTRGSSVILNSTSLPESRCWRARFSSMSSALTTIERNFSIVNSRPRRPMRVCRNSTGPWLDSRTVMARNASTGLSAITPRTLAMRSTMRFRNSWPLLNRGVSTWMRGRPATGRVCSRGPATSMMLGASTRCCLPASRLHEICLTLSGGRSSVLVTATVSAPVAAIARSTALTEPMTGISVPAIVEATAAFGTHAPTTR